MAFYGRKKTALSGSPLSFSGVQTRSPYHGQRTEYNGFKGTIARRTIESRYFPEVLLLRGDNPAEKRYIWGFSEGWLLFYRMMQYIEGYLEKPKRLHFLFLKTLIYCSGWVFYEHIKYKKTNNLFWFCSNLSPRFT